MSKETFQHLEALREIMRQNNVDAFIIPGTDPHHSEYTHPHWKFRDYVSGFTGSNGTAAVTLDKAALWTDSRYFLQADEQLQDSGFELVKEGIEGEPSLNEWLAQNLEEDSVVAINGRLFSLIEANRLELFCGENGFMFLTDFYPEDSVWPDRPPRPMNPAYVHDEQYAGEGADSKMQRVMQAVKELGADSLLVTALDEIAWLFNLRGSDVEFTPVVIAFAYLSLHDRVLFIDEDKITKEVKQHLKDCDVKIKDYDEVEKFLEHRKEREVMILDPNMVSDALGQAMLCQKTYMPSPIIGIKAIKNEVQIAGFRSAMERDGAALVRLMMWIEQTVPTGAINEVDVWTRGQQERAKGDLYRGDSFAMICGYREHGAIVHYQADDESASTLQGEGLLLIDSGGQYLDGTTDITRTITLGNPTANEIHDYTLVLKGHLALARAQFPVGTRGVQLDVLARQPLWNEGMGYLHGTGHGVGHFLGCHEGPQSIRLDLNPAPLRPGMIMSDEPGIYKTGEYGIRTENLLLCVEGPKTEQFGDFLKFETLTLFPYDNRLIDVTMLTTEELKQVNDYHAMVLERLTPYLQPEELTWLTAKCAPLMPRN